MFLALKWVISHQIYALKLYALTKQISKGLNHDIDILFCSSEAQVFQVTLTSWETWEQMASSTLHVAYLKWLQTFEDDVPFQHAQQLFRKTEFQSPEYIKRVNFILSPTANLLIQGYGCIKQENPAVKMCSDIRCSAACCNWLWVWCNVTKGSWDMGDIWCWKGSWNCLVGRSSPHTAYQHGAAWSQTWQLVAESAVPAPAMPELYL